MQLEDYFLFLGEDDIRIKGHRVGIDNVLFYFLEGYTPEEIRAVYPELSLEKIYATITYYLQNGCLFITLQELARDSLPRGSKKSFASTRKDEKN
jgi:uncharacterized protein (DUF433 family)